MNPCLKPFKNQHPLNMINTLRKAAVILAILLMLMPETVSSQATDTRVLLTDNLQHKLDSITQKGLVPGVTFAVCFSNGQTTSLASGYADVELQQPMKPNSIMFTGSVGKTFVAAIILQLVDEGSLVLDELASKYLDGQAWFHQIPNAQSITIRMLLNHTAGIPEWAFQPGVWESVHNDPDKTWTAEERMSKVIGLQPSNPAGKGWSYADSHYIILGAIIEQLTGNDYYNELSKRILKPYGLTNTTPAVQRFLPGLVAGYTSLSNELLLPKKVAENQTYAFNPQLEWTGGGLVTNVSDLCVWAKIVWSGKLFAQHTYNQMITAVPFKTGLFEDAGYGLGCFVGSTNGTSYYGHTGFVPGYITFVQYIPEFGVSLAMQFTSDASHTDVYMKQFFNTLKETILIASGI